MTGPDGASPSPSTGGESDDAGTRRSWRVAGFGTIALGGLLAALNAGGGGRHGLRAFLLGAFIACGAGSLYAVASGAIDTFRGRNPGRRRIVAAAVLGGLTVAIPLMLVGLGT